MAAKPLKPSKAKRKDKNQSKPPAQSMRAALLTSPQQAPRWAPRFKESSQPQRR